MIFGQIIRPQRYTDTHKQYPREKKTAENDPLRFAIFGSCFPEKSSWTLTAGPFFLPPHGFHAQGPGNIWAPLGLNPTELFSTEKSARYASGDKGDDRGGFPSSPEV